MPDIYLESAPFDGQRWHVDPPLNERERRGSLDDGTPIYECIGRTGWQRESKPKKRHPNTKKIQYAEGGDK